MLGLADLGIRDECDTIGPLEHEASGGRVQHLPRDGENLDAQRHAGRRAPVPVGAQHERQHVEEERAIVLRLERHEAPSGRLGRQLVQRPQVCRLPAESRPVVHEL